MKSVANRSSLQLQNVKVKTKPCDPLTVWPLADCPLIALLFDERSTRSYHRNIYFLKKRPIVLSTQETAEGKTADFRPSASPIPLIPQVCGKKLYQIDHLSFVIDSRRKKKLLLNYKNIFFLWSMDRTSVRFEGAVTAFFVRLINQNKMIYFNCASNLLIVWFTLPRASENFSTCGRFRFSFP